MENFEESLYFLFFHYGRSRMILYVERNLYVKWKNVHEARKIADWRKNPCP